MITYVSNFEFDFLNIENNIYLLEDKPFASNYLLPDEYNILSSKYPLELSVFMSIVAVCTI